MARTGNGSVGKPAAKATGRIAEPAAHVDVPPVQVIVTKMVPEPGRYKYRYTVVNGSAFPISDLAIGMDYARDLHELRRAPLGWNGEIVPPESYQAPPGWSFRNVTVEEDTLGYIKWEIAAQGGQILGGASLGGFEVTLSAEDQAYENGHWTAYLDTTEEPLYTAGLQPSGVTAVPLSSVYAKSDLLVKPNPSRKPVGIEFAVPIAGISTVDVFDVQGRRVARVLSKSLVAGTASVVWDGRDNAGNEVAAGVYFVRVKTPTTQRFARITWLK
ncbi:MAG: FlgD immunoglobulin-like domain containing protein [Candidatus Eisenbacteria bacterium]